ncbi:MAG: tetratricopeptide repeat protein [Butyricicoccaceae bacterium]
MLSKIEKRIRACYDAFLEAVTEDRDLWEIALLEYYRWPLEAWREDPQDDWEQPIPDCFADLAPELPRLTACKGAAHPNDDCATVQLSLEWRYGWNDSGIRDIPKQRLSPEAAALLLEYYFLVEVQGDDCGDRHCRILFEGESDLRILERIVGHAMHTPEEQMALALRLKELELEDDLDGAERDWLLDLIEGQLDEAFRRGCGEAGWHLYEFLSEKERFGEDTREPLDLLREAAEAGSVDAQCEICWQFYTEVMNMPKESFLGGYCGDQISGEEAVRWMEAALPHKIDVVPCLAGLLLDGNGVPANPARAVRALTAAVEGRHEGSSASVDQWTCFWMLAKCYAEGMGVARDKRKAAELYRQAQDSGCYLFDYYRKGVDVPRNPRAAVRYWMRDMCFHHGLLLWVDILVRASAPEGCVRLGPDLLRILRKEWQQSGEEAFYALMLQRMDRFAVSGRTGTDDPFVRLSGLLDRERVRLLYDGAQGGDGRCEDILQELLASGAATQEMLEELCPNRSGVYDWPDAWYEETLESIEDQLAREKEWAEQIEDLESEEPMAFDGPDAGSART